MPSYAQSGAQLKPLVCCVQIGLVASQFSLPMLAPLLFGTGILLRSIRTNASLIFPRIGVVVVLLWMLWFFNSVVQNTVVYLRRQVGHPPCWLEQTCLKLRPPPDTACGENAGIPSSALLELGCTLLCQAISPAK